MTPEEIRIRIRNIESTIATARERGIGVLEQTMLIRLKVYQKMLGRMEMKKCSQS